MPLLKANFTHRPAQQELHLQRQRQLPPLQEIVRSDSDTSTDKQSIHEDNWQYQTAFIGCDTTSNTTTTTGPNHYLGSSMPILSSNFEEVGFRTYGEDMLSGSGGWGSTSQYSNGPSSYTSSSTSSHGYYNRPTATMNGRSSQNLPSLLEMNLAQTTPVYNSRPMQVSRPHGNTSYYCPSPTDPLEMSYSKTSQSGVTSSMYNQTPRSSYTMSVGDYGSSMYEPCCYPNGTSWPPSMQCPVSNYVGSDTASVHSMGRRRRGNLPKHVTDILRAWFHEHLDHPYPTDEDKQMLIAKTQLTMSQISNWFINARRRHWPALKAQREQMHKLPSRHANSNSGHC